LRANTFAGSSPARSLGRRVAGRLCMMRTSLPEERNYTRSALTMFCSLRFGRNIRCHTIEHSACEPTSLFWRGPEDTPRAQSMSLLSIRLAAI